MNILNKHLKAAIGEDPLLSELLSTVTTHTTTLETQIAEYRELPNNNSSLYGYNDAIIRAVERAKKWGLRSLIDHGHRDISKTTVLQYLVEILREFDCDSYDRLPDRWAIIFHPSKHDDLRGVGMSLYPKTFRILKWELPTIVSPYVPKDTILLVNLSALHIKIEMLPNSDVYTSSLAPTIIRLYVQVQLSMSEPSKNIFLVSEF